LIPSLARDTAPFICLGTGVSLPKTARLSEIVNTDTATSASLIVGRDTLTRHEGLLSNVEQATYAHSEFYGL